MTDTNALRKHLLYLLGGGGAHVDFDSVIAGWPAKARCLSMLRTRVLAASQSILVTDS